MTCEQVGVVTATDLAQAAAILRELPLEIRDRQGPRLQYQVVGCDIDDFVATALLKMTQAQQAPHRRLRRGVYVGVLEDIDLLAFVAGGRQLVGARIDRAARPRRSRPRGRSRFRAPDADVAPPGVKIDVVCEIVSDLNRRLLARAFRLTAPRSIAEKGCLIVMGSEGRAEQTVRTDQDNGLILSDPVPRGRSRRLPRRRSRARWSASASRLVPAT